MHFSKSRRVTTAPRPPHFWQELAEMRQYERDCKPRWRHFDLGNGHSVKARTIKRRQIVGDGLNEPMRVVTARGVYDVVDAPITEAWAVA